MGIIYKVTNKLCGKCYIGKTTQKLHERKGAHKRSSFILKCNDYFHSSIRKYGWGNFEWEIIFECDDKNLLNIMETFKIMVNNSYHTEGGYNLTWGGDGQSTGFKHTEETKKKIGAYWLGRKRTQKNVDNLSEAKKHQTDETKRKNSITKIGNKYGKKYNDNVIEQALTYRNEGKTFRWISEKMNIKIPTIQNWYRKRRDK